MHPVCEIVRNMVAALYTGLNICLNELGVANVRAHPGIGAVLRKLDDMADICVRIRYS